MLTSSLKNSPQTLPVSPGFSGAYRITNVTENDKPIQVYDLRRQRVDEFLKDKNPPKYFIAMAPLEEIHLVMDDERGASASKLWENIKAPLLGFVATYFNAVLNPSPETRNTLATEVDKLKARSDSGNLVQTWLSDEPILDAELKIQSGTETKPTYDLSVLNAEPKTEENPDKKEKLVLDVAV